MRNLRRSGRLPPYVAARLRRASDDASDDE